MDLLDSSHGDQRLDCRPIPSRTSGYGTYLRCVCTVLGSPNASLDLYVVHGCFQQLQIPALLDKQFGRFDFAANEHTVGGIMERSS